MGVGGPGASGLRAYAKLSCGQSMETSDSFPLREETPSERGWAGGVREA